MEAVVAPTRDGFIVTICIPDFVATPAAVGRIAAIARQLESTYAYWEMIVVVDDSRGLELIKAEDVLLYLRALRTRPSEDMYRRRVLAASESLGDVVVMTSTDEIATIDVPKLIDTCVRTQEIVVARRPGAELHHDWVRALGRSAGFRVSQRDMLSAAYPRRALHLLLKHHDPQLALRFPPRYEDLPVTYVEFHAPRSRRPGAFRQRLDLVGRLVSHASPNVLTALALASLVVLATSLVFTAYAVIVWLAYDDVQRGWLTSVLPISLSTAFLGLSMMGIALGLRRILSLLEPASAVESFTEISGVDVFAGVAHDLNVEVVAHQGNRGNRSEPTDAPVLSGRQQA
jgi:hypothetical protein